MEKSYSPESEEISYNSDMRTQNDVREFILAESKKAPGKKGSLAVWSRAIGRKDSYLYDFVKKGTPRKLDEDDRAKLAAAMGVDESQLLSADQKPLSPQSLMSAKEHITPVEETFRHNARIGSPVSGFVRVPIRGQTMGGKDGALIFNADEFFGEVDAPSKLSGIPDAYAVYVIGDSMLERYRHGEVVFVHPYAPVQKDDDVVIQISLGDGEPAHGWVKRFVSRDDKSLKVRQLNPKKLLTFPANRVIAVHKIIMGGPA